jgi:hypothetical protein
MSEEVERRVHSHPKRLETFKAMERGRVTKRRVLVGVVLPGPAEKGLPHGW